MFIADQYTISEPMCEFYSYHDIGVGVCRSAHSSDFKVWRIMWPKATKIIGPFNSA